MVLRLKFHKLLVLVLFALGTSEAHSHGPGGHAGISVEVKASAEFQAKTLEINKRYVEQVKPIFMEKCGDCHSSQIHYPWYHAVPGIGQLIDHDHNEAMKHMDISSDFPFRGHGSPREDLRAIQESLKKDSMPPFRYRLLHWKSKLTAEEKKVVTDWAASGELLLTK